MLLQTASARIYEAKKEPCSVLACTDFRSGVDADRNLAVYLLLNFRMTM